MRRVTCLTHCWEKRLTVTPPVHRYMAGYRGALQELRRAMKRHDTSRPPSLREGRSFSTQYDLGDPGLLEVSTACSAGKLITFLAIHPTARRPRR